MEETVELIRYTESQEDDEALAAVVQQAYEEFEPGETAKAQSQRSLEKIENNLLEYIKTPVVTMAPARSKRWLQYAAAAAIAIIAGTALYYYFDTKSHEKKDTITQTNPHPVETDIAPGANKAVLTLADGRQIVLDEARTGELAKEDNATITKTKEGEIKYDSRLTTHDARLSYNTMSTPRGGQYQLTLPDGTKVWLNAASSITYPTTFTQKERRVTVSGEAYFEVTHDKAKPFFVTVSRLTTPDMTIEVLGTHFNVNAYQDENSINTTLIEGSVRLTTYDSRLTSTESRTTPSKNAVHTSIQLKPGQQGQLRDRQLSLAVNPDIDQAMAWRKALFNFNNLTTEQVMKQISRWYDVDIKYQAGIPEMTFGGKVGRDLTLQQVLNGLQAMGLRCKIENKTIIVMP